MEHEHESAAAAEVAAPPVAAREGVPALAGNRAMARGAARAVLARRAAAAAGNRATAALLSRSEAQTTEDMHRDLYGDDPSSHHPGRIPGTPPPSDAPTVKPPVNLFPPNVLGPAATGPSTLPKGPGPAPGYSKDWLEDALRNDKLLKELPKWAREKAIDGLKDADETIAEKIIEALPWDDKLKAAATAALKAALQMAKGKKYEPPKDNPYTRRPEWQQRDDLKLDDTPFKWGFTF